MAWNKLGQLKKSKKGSLYIQLEKDVTLKSGASLQLQDPRKGIQRGVESGKLTQEAADEKIARVPEFVKYDVFEVTDEN